MQNKLSGYDKEFEEKVGCACAAFNEAIMRIMADSIDTIGTESQYKVIEQQPSDRLTHKR